MTASFSPALLKKLSEQISQRMGMFFAESQWGVLERAFDQAADGLECRDGLECAQHFLAAPNSRKTLETMASYLTIGETYFWRDPKSFDVLEQKILPELLLRRADERTLRFWSVGCASGEEPYTLAIRLHHLKHRLKNWRISILASDINPQALEKARKAEYTDWSFRNTPPWFKQQYFTQQAKGRYALKPTIRDMVQFEYLNLMENPVPARSPVTGAMDVILCRNVLMYFPAQVARKAVERLHDNLNEGGWLLVSPCELSIPSLSGFSTVTYPEATVYQKRHSSDSLQQRPLAPATTETALLQTGPSVTPARLFPWQQESQLPSHRQKETASACQAVMEQCRRYADQGNLSEALRFADQAIDHDKLNAGLHYLRAMILQEQGAVEQAEQALRRTVYIDRKMVLAHFSLGNLCLHQGKNRQAQRHFNHALALLEQYSPDEVLPEAEGMSANRLKTIIRAMNADAHKESRRV
nr:CheR family methyltransferase [uncultured Desulfuromonas sp.]